MENNKIEKAAEKWVFETNGNKWSNNDNTAGDNYNSFIAGAKWQQEQESTKRGYFAAMAMQGLISNSDILYRHDRKTIAEYSVKHADLLLKELEKNKSE